MGEIPKKKEIWIKANFLDPNKLQYFDHIVLLKIRIKMKF